MAMLMLPAPQQLTYPWCLAALGLRAKAFDIDVEEETRVGEIGVTFSVRPFQSRSILRQPSIRSVSADASALPWKRASCGVHSHAANRHCGVRNEQNLIESDDAVEPVGSIAKSERLVYSIVAAIFLRLKELPKLDGSSPFFGTSYFCRCAPNRRSACLRR
jgi:hypothetical protein